MLKKKGKKVLQIKMRREEGLVPILAGLHIAVFYQTNQLPEFYPIVFCLKDTI